MKGLKKEDDWMSAYRQNHWNQPISRRGRRYNLYRVAAAFLVFFVFWAIKENENPWSMEAKETLRSVLTTEWNYRLALEKVAQFGLQVANTEWPLFQNAQPVTANQQYQHSDRLDNLMPVPVFGKVVREYGMTIDPVDGMERFHSGIDIAAPVGSSVRAVREGKVKRIGDSAALGKFVLLEHETGNFTLYAGLSRVALNEGDPVIAGQSLGESGMEGDIPGGGLHFEIRENNKLVDPLLQLRPFN